MAELQIISLFSFFPYTVRFNFLREKKGAACMESSLICLLSLPHVPKLEFFPFFLLKAWADFSPCLRYTGEILLIRDYEWREN